MTNISRLLLELSNKQLIKTSDMNQILEEHGLDAESAFSSENDMIALKKSALQVLSIAANDVDNLVKTETEFLTSEALYKYLRERIKDIKADIEELREEERLGTDGIEKPAMTGLLFYDYEISTTD